MSGIETLIIGGLLHLPEYQGKVLPYIKHEYFTEKSTEEVFKLIQEYNNTYNKLPTLETLEIELDNKIGLTEKQYQESKELISKLYSEKFINGIKAQDSDWILNTSENYIVDRACELAVYESHSIISGENKKLKRDAIPEILNSALSISFDTEIGHSYLDDIEKRYEFYHSKVQRIPFYLSMLDFITKGGCPRKTLTVPVAPTGVGKSVFMTNWAAELIQNGYNVLYVTLEMAEERIAERIDAKLLNVTMDELQTMSKEAFMNKFKVLKRKTLGKIFVKEFQPGVCNANHIRHLMKELKTKKNFTPDVIMVDYLNLASSYRVGLNVGGYAYIKAVTEELRGLAMQNNVAVISPTQTNRSGQNATDFELNEVGESHGIAVTADLMFGLISTPELEQLGHLRIKQLKNRFNSIYMPASFLVGIARAKMTLFDVDMPQTKILVGSKTEQEEIDNSQSISQQNNNINNKPLATPSLNNKPTLKTNLKF